MTSTSIYFQNALVTALQRYPKIHEKWISVYMRMAGQAKIGFSHNQSDGRIDILLRAMEDEAVERLAKDDGGNMDMLFAYELQSTLTRYWLFSTYEMIRIAKNAEGQKENAALQELYRRLQLVRVPLAKFEIANDRKIVEPILLERYGDGPKFDPVPYAANAKAEYNPVQVTGLDNGSVGWWVIDAVNNTMVYIFRRDLSDELLALYADSD